MEKKLCYGCMKQKSESPVCEHCGWDETKPAQPHQLLPGTVLQNQYIIGRVLGQGGFGITYLGWDTKLQTVVAIKEYFPSGIVYRKAAAGTQLMFYRGEDESVFVKHRDRFLKEARILAQLSNIPEIVQIFNFFGENHTGYIVMEFVEGITLKDHIKRKGRPLTVEETFDLLQPVLSALEKVHARQLIHRDISPDNIMLLPEGGVKIIDFGAVRLLDEANRSKSTESILKPGFAPIEQYNARGNMGPWTDVYALCATYHYCLTGKIPPDAPARLDGGSELPALQAVAGLDALRRKGLEQGLHLRTAQRTQSMEELYRDLYTVPAPEVKSKKRNPVIPVLAAVGAVAAAAAIFLAVNRQPADAPAETQNVQAVLQESAAVPETTSIAPTEPAGTADQNISSETQPAAVNLQAEKTGSFEYHNQNIDVSIVNGRDFTITVSDVEFSDSYPVIREDSTRRKYEWFVELEGLFCYKIVTGNLVDGSETRSSLSVGQMPTTIWFKSDAESEYQLVGQAQASVDDNSITWTGTIPQNVPFDYEIFHWVNFQYRAGFGSGLRSWNLGNPESPVLFCPVPVSGPGVQEFHDDNIDVWIENERDYTIRVSGLDLADRYLVNRATAYRNSVDYSWSVELIGPSSYQVITRNIAYEPGQEQSIPIRQMDTSLLKLDPATGFYTGGYVADVMVTPTSIIWKGKIYEGAHGENDFDFRDVTEIRFTYYDAYDEGRVTVVYPVNH